MKIRVIGPEGKVRFLEESITRNMQFMKKYGLKVQHLDAAPAQEIPEGNIIPDKPIEELPLLSDGFIPETIVQKTEKKAPAKNKPVKKTSPKK